MGLIPDGAIVFSDPDPPITVLYCIRCGNLPVSHGGPWKVPVSVIPQVPGASSQPVIVVIIAP